MKIVQINAVFKFSSTGRNTSELHEYLKAMGHESYVFCTNYRNPNDNIFTIGSKFDYKAHAIGSRIFGLQGYFSKDNTRNLVKQLKAICPDVVLLGNLHANYINLKILFEYLSEYNVATVLVLHDTWFFTGHCCHYTEDSCYKWMTECHDCPTLHKYNKSLFFDNSKRIFRDRLNLYKSISRLAIVGVSDWITAEAQKSPMFSRAVAIQRIYNWIDIDTFYPRDTTTLKSLYGIKTDDTVILGVAQSWSNTKGLDRFIALANLNRSYKVVLIGKIGNDIVLPDNIIRVGVVADPNKLAEYYSLADVFLNCSIQETFGKVSAEALACGTPIVTNNATANPEVAEGCGHIVNTCNVEDIYSSIETIKNDGGKSYYMSLCREKAESLFEMQENLHQYISMFENII
jgi:glycosyltransferase involved in cell wall biosynthesis